MSETELQSVVSCLEEAQQGLSRLLTGLERGTITAPLVELELDHLEEVVQLAKEEYAKLQEPLCPHS